MNNISIVFKWFLALFVLAGIGSCILFPARSNVSKIRRMKFESDAKLNAFVAWKIAHTGHNSKNGSMLLNNLRDTEKYYLFDALKDPSKYNSESPTGIFDMEICLEKFSDYVICTNSININVVLNNIRESSIVAYERPGLVDENSVAVYFKDLGVLRLKTSDFYRLISGGGCHLKYDKKTHLWMVEK